MNTYQGKINEFINWTTGENAVTGNILDGVSKNNPISGKSIRELILDKLRTPFITYKDDAAGYIRFFSSEDAKKMWENYAKPDSPSYNPEIAEDFVLYNMDLPATYKITGFGDKLFELPRYIIDGNSNSLNGKLEFTLGLEDSLGSTESDVITVSYTIKDSSENITYNESQLVSTGTPVSKNIYRYLRSGDNTVSITATANNHPAKTSKTFHIYIVTFSISSNFGGYYTGVSNNRAFSFDVAVRRSITNLPITTTIYIDDPNEATPIDTWRYTDTGANPSHRFEIRNNYAASTYDNNVKHRMLIKSVMSDEEGQSFESNVLIYEFEVSSNLGDLVNSFVNCAYSISRGKYTFVEQGKPVLQATLYVPFTLDWGYYTDAGSQQVDINWLLRTGTDEYTYYNLTSILGAKGTKPTAFSFIPSTAYQFETDNSYLVATIDDEVVEEFPINIAANDINVSETGNYSLKLSAYGKTNSSESKDLWTDFEHNVTTTFSQGVSFDNNNGWDNNSLVLRGIDSYATINYLPFPETYDGLPYNILDSGAAFEIDFKPEQVDNEDDVLLTIGDTTKSYIAIKPTSAAFYENSTTPTIKTNFKAGERIKLCFIFNRFSEISNDSNLIYIVNNGILERAAVKGNASINSAAGKIKIGGSRSGIRVYQIRAYRHDISPKQALDNYMFDNIDNSTIISRNDVYGNSSTITYAGLQGKQDIIIIEGNLSNILNNAQTKENATVNITRESNTDSSKNFTINNCRIRNHGQSTLSYPITSMKMWFNKSNKFQEVNGNLVEQVPELICQSLQYLGLNKNRYMMKNGSIPANKFVLQANYADSSGSHNGSLLRLIQDTWYNAQIGDSNQFKLRTSPQLFASGAKITHDNPSLNEDGSWVDGVYNVSPTDTTYNSDYANKTWPEISNGQMFPYIIRNAADSFPCVVFYRDSSSQDQNLKLLGQYVFMDDKKSDYVYGERSIYYTDDPTDPFCLKIENKKKDTKSNRVWDNKGVLQIEVVYPNSPLTSYSSKTIASSYTLDENDNLIPSGEQHRFNDVYTSDQNGKPTSYYWEQHFELIYPDKEDITDSNDNFDPDKFTETVKPFEDFMEWITDVAELKSTGTVIGDSGSFARVTQAELDKFMAEAHDHLDLYKLAAYYIFFLRFGLIDSVERNALLKTYDGQHWHYEPWDMDIALGCANNGVIAYEPPLTRDTIAAGTTYAFSGRTATQSNVLWDCLECWDYWANTLVPEVAEALYQAGLTYDNASKMFDEEYVEKWSETLYNESGHYKYIDATKNSKYRLYLNGARTSHRHWWLSKSMNYYDAKWSCGDFTKHSVQFRISKPQDAAGYNLIKIYPTSPTFFKAQYGSKGDDIITTLGDGLTQAGTGAGEEAVIDSFIQLEDKQPCFIFGATSIEGLDLSGLLTSSTGNLGRGYTDISFSDAYDNVLGASIKFLKLGAPCYPDMYTNPDETTYESNLSIGQNGIDGITEDGHDALENLELLDINGWCSQQVSSGQAGWISNLFSGTGYDRKNINKLYAMGCTTATEFATSNAGNKFEELRLPSSITTLEFSNSSWDNISFWDTETISSTRARYTKITGIPASINKVSFKGSTAKNQCSLDFVLSWINSIEAQIRLENPSYTDDQVEEALYTVLATKTFYAEQVNWGAGSTKIYYKDLIRLSHFGNDGILNNIKGYVVISDQQNLTAIQLSTLMDLFGDYVFNIGTTNTNLVVDLNNGYVRISIKANVDPNTNELYMTETESATASATSFTLSSNQYENTIIDTAEHRIQDMQDGEYLWALSAEENGDTAASIKSATLLKRANGGIMITTNEGDYGDYSIYVHVYYKDGATVKHDFVKLNIIGVTYPQDFRFVAPNATVRKFLYTPTVGRSIFGQQTSWPDTYIMSAYGYNNEFRVEAVGDYTATIQNVDYWVADIDNTSNNTGWISASDLQQDDDSVQYIGDDTLFGYTRNATRGGIPVKVIGNPTDTIKKYRISARVQVGARTETRNIFVVVCDDNEPIIRYSNSDMVYLNLRAVYAEQFSNPAWQGDFYKLDLLSFEGTLDFSAYPTISSLITTTNRSIFTYTKYITGIVLDGLVNLPLVDSVTGALNLYVNEINNLQTLSVNGCTSMIGTLDLSGCNSLLTLDAEGTSISVVFGSGSSISTLKLGSPAEISITNPKVLTSLSVEDNTNIDSITLVNVNSGDPATYTPATVRGFNIFDTLHS